MNPTPRRAGSATNAESQPGGASSVRRRLRRPELGRGPVGLQALLDRLADYGRPESSLVLDDVVEWGVITAADSPGAS